jgi:3-oxoacyl-[acyl-carrier protein] reductase
LREPSGSEPISRPGPGEAAGAAVVRLLEEVAESPAVVTEFAGLHGRTAIVTGGSTGIGRAIALELAAHGANIAFNFVDDEEGDAGDEAERTAAELRLLEVGVYCAVCDVRDAVAIERFVAEVRSRFGGIHILVNNAGIARDRALWHMSDAQWSEVLETNLTGAFNMLRAVAPMFRAQQYGKVVNISSVHGLRSEFGLANYAASKAGLLGLTSSAAVELGPANVNVNAVAPGYIRTTRLTDSVPAELLDRARSQSALRRLGDPQDVAHVVAFLCSELARHVTGVVIPVDGGYLL